LPQRVVLQHQRNAESGQNRVERIAADQGAQRDDLHCRAENGDDERSTDQRQPETSSAHEHDEAEIGAEHE
jgi:hypothetical protein